MVLARLITSNS